MRHGRPCCYRFGRAAPCGPVETFPQVHQREERGENSLLQLVRERWANNCDVGKFLRCGLHVASDFGLTFCVGCSDRRFAAHPGASPLHAQNVVEDAEPLSFEFTWHRGVTARQAGEILAELRHACPPVDSLNLFSSKGNTKVLANEADKAVRHVGKGTAERSGSLLRRLSRSKRPCFTLKPLRMDNPRGKNSLSLLGASRN